jgi:hypothetical protein
MTHQLYRALMDGLDAPALARHLWAELTPPDGPPRLQRCRGTHAVTMAWLRTQLPAPTPAALQHELDRWSAFLTKHGGACDCAIYGLLLDALRASAPPPLD